MTLLSVTRLVIVVIFFFGNKNSTGAEYNLCPIIKMQCLQCFRRLGESTSVTGRDFKRDPLFKPGWLVNR